MNYQLLETPLLVEQRFPRNGIWKTEIVFSKLSLNTINEFKHNQCM